MKLIKALLFKFQDDNAIAVKGPLTAQKARHMDADYIVFMCDAEELADPKNKEDVDIFKSCLMSSTLDCNPLDQMCTIGYMLGTVANLRLKDFNFEKLNYEGF